MEDKTIIIIVAITAIVILESLALIQKVDGALLSLGMAVIAGLGGYVIKSPFDKPII